ncbi:hypothetical protein UPYG_G00286350 [Umbra pygmaea]|uniref:Phosphatidylinositol-specific phospholipase C X domain-containing protein n=1 Tax=Umbra pygmaea TaxID=75934 RepID=A0ABD0W4N9_UMBPY
MRSSKNNFFTHLYMSVLLVGSFCQEYFDDHALKLPESYKIGWMEAIDDDKLLSDITIPGTHDTMALYGGPAAECQAWDVDNQLRAGIRYVDLRIVALEKKLYVVHGIVNQHMLFVEVFNVIKRFLSEFSHETVLLRIKPELIRKNNVEKQVRKIISKDEAVWVKSDMPTMGKARGKVVFVQKSSFKLGVPLLETDSQGDYKVTHIPDKQKKVEKHLLDASVKCGGAALVLSYSSGTGIGTRMSMRLTPKKVAEKINPWLGYYLRQYSSEHTKACFGVIAMDFPGFDLIQTAIKFNHV